MKLKITMKIGDESHTLDKEQSKSFGNNGGLEQLLQAKGMLTQVMSMIDMMEPNQAGKRIEMILEFEDGQYIVIGRKEVDPDDGR